MKCSTSLFIILVNFWISKIYVLALNDQPQSLGAPIHHPNCPQIDDEQHPVQLPHPNDCHKYYSCMNGLAYPMVCPDQLQWSILTYRCDYPDIANCTKSNTSSIPVYPSEINVEVPTSNLLHYQAYPEDCNQFYQCQLMRCPSKLYWNTNLQRCDFQQQPECKQQPLGVGGGGGGVAINIPTPTTTTTISPAIDINSIPMSIPTAATPPATTIKPPVTPTTKEPAQTPTSNDDGVAPTPNTDPNLDSLCSDIGGEEYIRHPDNCHMFIQCNGIAFIHTCPANLFWNSELKTCDRYCK